MLTFLAKPPTTSAAPRRQYRSTYVVAALTIAVLVLTIVPGNYQYVSRTWTHGWPWTFETRYRAGSIIFYNGSLNPTAAQWTDSLYASRLNPWSLTADVRMFNGWLLLANFIVGCIITTGVCIVWSQWRRRRNEVYQFYLRDLFFLTATAAIACAWIVNIQKSCRAEQAAADAIYKDLRVFYEYQSVLPAWLVQWVGRSEHVGPFDQVVGAAIYSKSDPYSNKSHPLDETRVDRLQALSHLERIVLENPNSNLDLPKLGAFANLRELYFFGPLIKLSDRDLQDVKRLPCLETLMIDGHSQVSDEGIRCAYEAMPHLRLVIAQ